MDLSKLVTELQKDEGFRPYVYDDANGKPVIPGYTMVGHPTIGYGWALDKDLCSQELGGLILNYQASDSYSRLLKDIPWLSGKPESIQRALANIAFNIGVQGLLRFYVFVSLIQQGRYTDAANDLGTTLWFKQVGQRAVRIQELIKNAVD